MFAVLADVLVLLETKVIASLIVSGWDAFWLSKISTDGPPP